MTLKLNGTNSEAAPAYAGDDADTGLQCGTNELKLVTGGTARATVDSSGRVGIATSSPDQTLSVGAGSADTRMSINGTGQYQLKFTNSGADGFWVGSPGANSLAFAQNDGTTRMRIDSSGIIGVGVTPNAWGGSRKAIQFDSGGAAYICNDEAMAIVSNMYFNGSNNKYIRTDSASQVLFQDGSTQFLYAASGTAGNNISFSTAATIDSDGVKFQGDTAAANALDDYEEGTFTPTDASGQALTLAEAAGLYTKIGRMVHVQVRVKWPTNSNSAAAAIGGFPFNGSNAGTNISNGSNASGIGYVTGSIIPQLHMSASSNLTNFYNGTAGVTNAQFSGVELRFGIMYSTAT